MLCFPKGIALLDVSGRDFTPLHIEEFVDIDNK